MPSSRMGACAAVVILVTGCGVLDWLTAGRDDGAGGPDAAGSASAAPRPSGSPAVSSAPPGSGMPSASASAAPAAPPSPCPEEMALIADRFCIDRWEATTVEPDGTEHSPYHAVGPKRVKAVSRPGVVPQAYISFDEAEAACRRADKQICTTQQWLDACAGVGKNRRLFPYGPRPIAGVCNTNRPIHPSSLVHGQRKTDAYSLNDPRLNQLDDTVARTGAFTECVTPEGVSDLQGNLLEWTRGDQPLLMGGYYLDAKKHGPGCSYVTDGHGPEYHDFTTGFRCCKKPDAEALAAHLEWKKQAARRAAARPSRDPAGMRSFVDPTGKLPAPTPPKYDPPDAKCPVDMVRVKGSRCTVPVQLCLRWLSRVSHGQKISCAEFKQPSECTGRRVNMDYCIDRHEYTPSGYIYPLTHVAWGEAQNLCRAMHKRLCFEDEWEFACEGPDALPYPYGYVRDAKRCNHDFPEMELVTPAGDFIDRRVEADALPGCKSPFGVYNLVGNVDEWTTRRVAEAPWRSILRGGWWLVGRNRCRAATANHNELYAGMQTGFRCCKEVR